MTMRLITILSVIAIAGRLSAAEPSVESNAILRAAIATPKPEYPYAARYNWIQGSGLYKVRVQTSTGRVKEVTVVTSTKSQLLDQAAVNGLKRWKFKPGVLPTIRHFNPRTKDPFADEDLLFKVPISFVMGRHHRTGTYVVRQPL